MVRMSMYMVAIHFIYKILHIGYIPARTEEVFPIHNNHDVFMMKLCTIKLNKVVLLRETRSFWNPIIFNVLYLFLAVNLYIVL